MHLIQAISTFINTHAQLILDAGKITLALIMILFSVLGILIVINFTILKCKLQAMELNADQIREETVTLFTQARAGLKGLKDSLNESQSFDGRELLHSGKQLAMLLLNSERNILPWGILGFKMAGNALRYFFSRR